MTPVVTACSEHSRHQVDSQWKIVVAASEAEDINIKRVLHWTETCCTKVGERWALGEWT